MYTRVMSTDTMYVKRSTEDAIRKYASKARVVAINASNMLYFLDSSIGRMAVNGSRAVGKHTKDIRKDLASIPASSSSGFIALLGLFLDFTL